MDKIHNMILVLGRTASGKDTLVSKLCEKLGYNQLISYTTRPRRDNEGDTHIFVSEAAYQSFKESGAIAAETEIAGYHYWSTIDQIYESDIYVIDYNGLRALRELDLPNIHFASVFIHVPDEIRESRAVNERGDDRTVFRKRDYAETNQFRDMIRKVDYDYAISNIDFPKAYSVLHWISQIEGIWKNHLEGDEE